MTAPEPTDASFADKEPAVLTALLSTAVSLVLELLVRFGLSIPDDVKQTIMVAVPFVALVVTALRIRGLVFSPATWDTLQHDLDVTAQNLHTAHTMIDGHDDALRAVEGTVVSALLQVVESLQGPPAASVTPAPAVSSPSDPQPTAWPNGPSGTAVLPVTQAWSTSQEDWAIYPDGAVSHTQTQVSPYADPARRQA